MDASEDFFPVKRFKVVCLVGTRPECIKMAPVIKEFLKQDWANVTVVSTGQHRELVQQIFRLFAIQIDYDLKVMEPNQSLAGLTSKIFAKFDPFLASQGDLSP